MKIFSCLCSLPFLFFVVEIQGLIYKFALGKVFAFLIGVTATLIYILQLLGFCMKDIPIITPATLMKDNNESYTDYGVRLWDLVMSPAWFPEDASWLLKRVVVTALYLFRFYIIWCLYHGETIVDIAGIYV